jgi:hypothetical protein
MMVEQPMPGYPICQFWGCQNSSNQVSTILLPMAEVHTNANVRSGGDPNSSNLQPSFNIHAADGRSTNARVPNVRSGVANISPSSNHVSTNIWSPMQATKRY